MAPQTSSDAEKVAEFITDFQANSASLLEEATQAALRSQLRSAEEESSKQAGNHDEIEGARAVAKEAQDTAEAAAEAERAASAELGKHAEKLADVQAELASAKSEYAAAEKAGAQFAREGQKLREAKASHEVTVSTFEVLSGGTWTDEDAKSLALTSLQSYLEEIRAEKVLVAAVPGLGVQPEERGLFDKFTVDAISEVLTERAQSMEEQVAARAPAEKEAKTELMGLSALVDVCQEKVEQAQGEHAMASKELKTAKAAAKASQLKASKLETVVEKLSARHKMHEEKAEAAREALAALERLFGAAAEAQAVASEAVAEPEPKKAKTESVTSPRPEIAVASPARVRA